MEPTRDGDRPCYGRLPEKELLRLAQQENNTEAAKELLLRNLPWMILRIGMHARQDHLQAADWEDAKQESAVTFLTAIPRFDRTRSEAHGDCSLRTYGGLAVERRYYNFVRALGGATRAVASSPEAAEWLSGNAHAEGDLNPPTFLCAAVPDDPAELAQRHEGILRLAAAISQLDASDRRMIEQLLAGKHLTEIAREEERSYEGVKYQREKIWEELRERLKEEGM